MILSRLEFFILQMSCQKRDKREKYDKPWIISECEQRIIIHYFLQYEMHGSTANKLFRFKIEKMLPIVDFISTEIHRG